MFGELNGVLVKNQDLVLGLDGQMSKLVLRAQMDLTVVMDLAKLQMNALPFNNGQADRKFVQEEEFIIIKYMKPLGAQQKFQDQALGADGIILKIVREQILEAELAVEPELELEAEQELEELLIPAMLLVKMPLLGIQLRFI